MAAELFAEYSQFKPLAGGRINSTVELASLDPFIWDAARKHIVPHLSATVYNALVSAFAGNTMTSAQSALLPYVRRPLALLAIYEYSKVANVELSDSGMHRIETETRKAAYRYQEKQYQEDALEKGYDALEAMLIFLNANTATYTDWAASDEGKAHRYSLVNLASQVRLLTSHNCDRFSYETLRPLINHQQLMTIQQVLPASYWTYFIGRYVANTLSDDEKMVLLYMRNAIAYGAMNEAINQHYITISKGRVYVTEDRGDQAGADRVLPPAGSSALQSNAVHADRYHWLWKQYIYQHPTSFAGVFDTASGGTNTSADAWHVNTADEAQQILNARDAENKKGVYIL